MINPYASEHTEATSRTMHRMFGGEAYDMMNDLPLEVISEWAKAAPKSPDDASSKLAISLLKHTYQNFRRG